MRIQGELQDEKRNDIIEREDKTLTDGCEDWLWYDGIVERLVSWGNDEVVEECEVRTVPHVAAVTPPTVVDLRVYYARPSDRIDLILPLQKHFLRSGAQKKDVDEICLGILRETAIPCNDARLRVSTRHGKANKPKVYTYTRSLQTHAVQPQWSRWANRNRCCFPSRTHMLSLLPLRER